MIIPVRFHILTVLLFVQILSFGQANAPEQSCFQEITVRNSSTCQLFIYMQFFDGSLEPEFIGELNANDTRTYSTNREDVYVFAVNDLNQQVAGALSFNCESMDFEPASCFVESNQMAYCSNLSIFSMRENTSPRPVINKTAFASCGDEFSFIANPNGEGFTLWTRPNDEKVVTRDVHTFLVSEEVDELMDGDYTVEWFGYDGCYSRDEIRLQVSNCCSLRNQLIQDTIICDTSSLIITSNLLGENLCSREISGYVESLVTSSGGNNISDLDMFTGEADNLGPRLLRETTNRETFLLFDFGETIPAQSEICFLLRQSVCTQEFNNSNFELSAGITVFSLRNTEIFENEELNSSFAEFCITVTERAQFAKIEDLGNGCGIRLDAVKWRNNEFFDDFDYLWSTGETTDRIEVDRPGLYSVLVTDCSGCTAYTEVEVATEDCTPPPPCTEASSPPIVGADTYRMCFGEEFGLESVGLNDSDPDGFSLIWNVSAGPSNGSLDFRTNGDFIYEPNTGFAGTDQFTYEVCKQNFLACDGQGQFACATGVVNLEVGVNQFSFEQDLIRVCEDEENVILTVPETFSVVWSTGATSNSIPVIRSGLFSATVTNSNNCTVADNIEVVFDQNPVVNVSKTNDLNCSFDSTILSAEGGSTYEWSTGQTGERIFVDRPGLYEVTVTGSGECTSTATIRVNDNTTELTAEITGVRDVCSPDEQVVLSAFGGDTYQWSTGQSGQSISVVGPGIYSVIVTDSQNGCTSETSVEVGLAASFADAGVDRPFCSGERVAIGGNPVGPPGSTFTWSNGASGIIDGNVSGRIIVEPSQTQMFTLQVNNNGCIVEDVVTVIVEDLNLQTSPSQRICLGESVVLSAEGAESYLWSTGETTAEITVTPTGSQSYNVIGSTAAGCSDEQTISVEVSDFSDTSISDNQSICRGESVTIGATGGSVYAWSNGDVGSSISVSPNVSTSFTVTITDGIGCQATESVIVQVADAVTVNLGPDQTVCTNQTVNLIATQADSYLWSNGDTTQSIVLSPTESETYSVTITTGNCTATDKVDINVVDCLGSISGFALDDEGDGFSNNAIFLFNSDNNLLSTNTNADGFYQFTSLPPGDYILEQAPIAGYQDLSALDESPDDVNDREGTNNTIFVTLESGEDDTDNNFRDEIAIGDITGFAFDDFDNPIANSTISLSTAAGISIGSTITNAEGFYQFTAVPTGNYIIQQMSIPGFVDFSDEDESPDDVNDVDPANNLIFATVTSREVDEDNNFRDQQANGSISGSVLDDLQNPLETSIALFLFDLAGNLISSTNTNQDGSYVFASVSPGNYRIQLGTIIGFENVSDFDLSPEDDNDGVENADNFIFATLEAGETDTDNNFIVRVASADISGLIIDDLGNPLSSTIFLFDDLGNLIDSVNAEGFYEFTSIAAGEYVLIQGDIPGYRNFADFDVSPDADNDVDAANNRINVTLLPGVNDLGNNFVDQLIGGTISGFALDDLGNPLSSTIFLFNESLDDIIRSQTTNDEDGSYIFRLVPPGNYVLQQGPIAGFTNVSDFDRTPEDANDGDENANNLINVTLVSNEIDSDNNFIDEPVVEIEDEPETGTISGFSFIDVDGDGEGDSPFLSASISLLDEAGNLLSTTPVSNIGEYIFEGLQPGIYIVEEQAVAGFGDVSDEDTIGDIGDQDGLNDPVDNRIPVVLGAGEDDRGNNFVNAVLETTESVTRISGFVRIDLDGDEVLDEPIENAIIDLFIPSGVRQERTRTDENGFYEFVGYDPGVYIVVELQGDAQYESLFDRDESVSEFDLDGFDQIANNQIDVILEEGEHDADNNFANFFPNVGTIAGSVLEDLDNNNTGDRGIGGVLVSLFTIEDVPVAMRRTDSNGAFIFEGIEPGDYYLAETDLLGFEDVRDVDFINPDDGNDVDETNDIINVSIVADELDDGNNFINRRTESDIIETCTVFQRDDFVSGFGDFWISGGSNAVYAEEEFFTSGPGSIVINNDNDARSSIFSRPRNFESVNSITISFQYLTQRTEMDDFFVVEISSNGGTTFTEVRRFEANIDFFNEEWYNPRVSVASDLLSSETVIRIRSGLSSAAENLYLDDIIIEVCFDDVDDGDDGAAFTSETEELGGKFDLSVESSILLKNEDEAPQANYSIFPNPTSDYIYVNADEVIDSEIVISIYDPSGKRVLKRQINAFESDIRLDVQQLDSNQLYILQILNGNKEPQMLRFLKIK